MTALGLVMAVAAFLLLGLATDEHHRRLRGQRVSREAARLLRRGGWALLGAAFVAAVLAHGWIFGPVLAFGLWMTGAGAAFLLLNFVPARDRSC